jgi:retron-type reverse transcriptase
VLRVVRLFPETLIQEGYRLVRPRARTPQGGVIRPLLANIYLAKLDRALGAKGEAFVRYADDLRLSIRKPLDARQARKRTGSVITTWGCGSTNRRPN